MKDLLKKKYYAQIILRFIFIVKNKYAYILFIFSIIFNNSKKYTLLELTNGNRFIVRNLYDVVVLQEVFQDLIYKPLLDSVSGNNPIYIDIGGYIGDTAVFFSKSNLFTKLFIFEPLPDNYIILEKNLKINGMSRTSNLVKKAVFSNDNDSLNFFIDNNFGKSGVYENKSSLKKVSVQSINFSSILKNLDNVYLKIDCEGSELELLSGLQIHEFNKISVIMLEYHSKYYNLEILINLLEQNKFNITLIPHQIENDIGLILAIKN